jgi:hypothetical protein
LAEHVEQTSVRPVANLLAPHETHPDNASQRSPAAHTRHDDASADPAIANGFVDPQGEHVVVLPLAYWFAAQLTHLLVDTSHF